MKFRFIFFILVFLLFAFRPGDSSEKEKTYTVYINYPAYSVRADVLRENGKTKAKPEYTYYWYTNNDIKTTDGGFDGKLLHGNYKSFYRDMNLREQGKFCRGLKEGEWISWFAGGKIHELTSYSKGLKDGTELIYNERGELVSKKKYRKGLLHGKCSGGKSDSAFIYRNGHVKSVETQNDTTGIKTKKAARAGKQVKDTALKKDKSIVPAKKTKKDTAQSVKKSPEPGRKKKNDSLPAKKDGAKKPAKSN